MSSAAKCHPWILCCTKDGMVQKVVSAHPGVVEHCYKIECDSPLGLVLMEASEDAKLNPYQKRLVLMGDVKRFQASHALDKVAVKDAHFPFNCGKEFVFRMLTSTGDEIIGGETGATFQSMPTWLRCNDPHMKNSMLNHHKIFRIITHAKVCTNGECYSPNIKHHFHFIPEDVLKKMQKGNNVTITITTAKNDFIDDIKEIFRTLQSVTDYEDKKLQPTQEIDAESGYGDVSGINISSGLGYAF